MTPSSAVPYFIELITGASSDSLNQADTLSSIPMDSSDCADLRDRLEKHLEIGIYDQEWDAMGEDPTISQVISLVESKPKL